MHPIEAALETLVGIVTNNGKVPIDWIQATEETYKPASEWSIKIEDFAVIAHILDLVHPCKFLEIGSGQSTASLFNTNQLGLNISLEDDPEYQAHVSQNVAAGTGIILSYQHQFVQTAAHFPKRQDWRARVKETLLDFDPTIPDFRTLQKRVLIPSWLWTVEFDVIVVDGPIGGEYSSPGRSGTILLASKLVSKNGIVFVDDIHRILEKQKMEEFFAGRYISILPSGRMALVV